MDAVPVVVAVFGATYATGLWVESLAFRVAGKQPPLRALLFTIAPALGVAALTLALCAYLN